MIPDGEALNYETFRDCVSGFFIARLSPSADAPKRRREGKGRKNEIKPAVREAIKDSNSDSAELGETIEHLSGEIFTALPAELRQLTYSHIQNNAVLADKYSLPLDSQVYEETTRTLPLSVEDSLASYGMLSEPSDLQRLLEPVFSAYIGSTTSAPPEFAPSERAHECEICEREHLPLTYHHLIPRAAHAKAVKRGWHASWELNKVAWLCRPCHSFVHRIASNEDLAKDWYSVDLLISREDVQKWATWVSRIRWKKS
ncbi:hypothetical protein AAFC00_006694 [Neodothiora populina]|uniref:HNH domain-containing protein n=1 Tax=Neodothiora populina TaxID=2781224 RepID=A0ABR3PAU7_9PEZI